MKFAIFFVLLALPLTVRAQITLEHTYTLGLYYDFGPVEVDSGVWKYVVNNQHDSIWIFNLDHSLERRIILPASAYGSILLLSKHTFDLDDKYECLVSNGSGARIVNQDGKILFACDTCFLGYDAHVNARPVSILPSPIVQTDAGTKMIVWYNDRREVYSLPGKLPGCAKTLDVSQNPSGAFGTHDFPSVAYPNPASNQVRIKYELPAGLSSGELVLTDETGREVKRYRVTNTFSDLLIDGSSLPNGSYFYRVVTTDGASAAQKFEVVK